MLKDETLSEKHLLEQGFERPIAIVAYGGVRQANMVIVRKYDLKLDSGTIPKQIDILFVFTLANCEVIQPGVYLSKQIEVKQLQPISKPSERPLLTDKKGYEAGTGKSVSITMRSGHILSGK
ncbi:MAG: hypothetical protein OXM61_10905 [Candidatus Poribacteria bacterium]|nr:hypothetical protein [Candidatus Poribacteria bacterium]